VATLTVAILTLSEGRCAIEICKEKYGITFGNRMSLVQAVCICGCRYNPCTSQASTLTSTLLAHKIITSKWLYC